MPLQQILSCGDNRILYECEADSLRAAVKEAVAARVDLRGCDLRGCDLGGCSLGGCSLRGCSLGGCDLRGCDFGGCNLRGCDFGGCNLRGCNFRGAKINWQSHHLLAELLRRAAHYDIEKRKIAGLVAISTDWCWETFVNLDDPLREWAIGVLATYVTDGDEAPKEVLAARKEATPCDP